MATRKANQLVENTFSKYGSLTRQSLSSYLSIGQPRRYLYDLAADYPSRPGKMMRPSLCLANARIFGAPLERALPTAVAIELLHNALLVHDDIEDHSESRRGKPSLHSMHGVPLALNAGDLLLLTSMRPLLENRRVMGVDLVMRIFDEALRMARESAEGQALELGWRDNGARRLTSSDYLEMVLKKTCWLGAIFPLRAGALIGAQDEIALEPFVRLGFFIGAAFQIQDDLLNLEPSKGYGKEINGDLLEGKRTLMLIRLLQEAAPHERAELIRILREPRTRRTSRQVNRIRRLMAKYDCIEQARQVAYALSGAALHEFSRIYAGIPESPDRQFIEALAVWVVERN